MLMSTKSEVKWRDKRKTGGKEDQRWKNKKKKPYKSEDQIIDDLQEAYSAIDTSEVKKFSDLPLSKLTLNGLKENNFKAPTEIQRESLKFSLQGLDILGAAQTGSGKTLALLIPILERLYCQKWSRMDGLGALVITPTRELAFQIFDTLRKVGHHHDFSAGLVIGGKDLKFETKRMDRCNIVIGTPGRLLQHMDENPLFTCNTMKVLVLDEADRCLDMGFEQTMNSIIENLPEDRQTLLFSATQTKSVRDLGRLSLKDPMYVSVHENAKHSTPEGLRQSYVVCELDEKFSMLWSFLRNHKRRKILVFLTSCKQVKYVYEMLCRLRPGVSLMALYGSLHQMRRMAVYDSFCRKKHAVLFATDIAARGLDFPAVDWVFQLDCPEDTNTYVHRVGRTARYTNGGEALLVLLPSEEKSMTEQLAKRKVPIENIRVNPRKLLTPQRKMEAMLARDSELKASAQRAFVTYVKSVFLMKDKTVFNVEALDTDSYARSLGLAIPPRIRFLRKHMKNKEAEQGIDEENSSSSEGEEVRNTRPYQESLSHGADIYKFDAEESDNEDGDVLQLKRQDHKLEGGEQHEISEEEEILKKPTSKNKKALTKVALAKRVIKKKIVANKKIVFDEEGEVVRNAAKEMVSALALEYEQQDDVSGGINIESAKQVIREEDRFDKQRAREILKAKKREKKWKLKKQKKDEQDEDMEPEQDWESSEDEGPDLSWLPDPDKIYGKQKDSNEEENESEEGNDLHQEDTDHEDFRSEEDLSEDDEPKSKRRKTNISSKRLKTEGLSLKEHEELALQLLKSAR